MKDELTRKEIEINRKNGRAGYYSDGEERFEDRMNKLEEERMNLEAGWYCKNGEDEIKLNPAPKTNAPFKNYNRKHDIAFDEPEEKERSHGPILDKFIQDGKEHEAEQIKKNIGKVMKRAMLSEEEERVIKEKFCTPKKEYEAPKCEILEPDKEEEWKKFVPEDDLGVTDYSVPGKVCLSLRNHGWFVCHKDETAALWESRYDEVKENQDALFKDKVKEYLNANTVNYVSTGEEPEGLPVITLKEYSFDDILWRLMEIHVRKNHDYGNAAHESYKEFGLISYIIRLNDKMKRLKSLTKPEAEQQVADEKIEDTLMDLAAYAIMAIESLHSDE